MAIVGIDLGTTNSLVGIIQGGRPKLFRGDDGSTLIPSIVSLLPDGSIRVGTEAKLNRISSASSTIYSAKRFIGRNLEDVREWMKILPFDFSKSDPSMVRFSVGQKSYTPIEISSFVLRKLKDLAQTQLGEKVDSAVITVPAYFNDSQRQATKFAGELAGLEVLRIVNEPTAACLAYGLDKKARGTVAVFDLGGGTFDISVLRISEGVIEVLATNGDTALGGDDFDHVIAERIRSQLKLSDTPENRAALVTEAERVKCALTDSESAPFSVNGTTIRVSRAELQQWIRPILERATEPCLTCLKDAGVTKEQISDVILVGGSTRMPLVRDYVQELFGRLPICSINPDEVVAMGAAVQANILAGQGTGMLLLDVIPLSLGIETIGGVCSRIIHRNSTIPVSASETFTTYVDGQTSVDIHVLQGERELVRDNRSLARFQLKGLPPMPASIPKVEVEFIVDANGILSVRAAELRTGKVASIEVNPSYGLSDSEVEQMLFDASEFAEQDFNQRFLIEARTEAESVLRATRKALGQSSALVTEPEKTEIESTMARLEQSLSRTDHKQIRENMESLNRVTEPFANRILTETLRGNLKPGVES